MKMLTFSSRTAKEILRDPVNLGFGLGFPVVLILLLSAIQANIPVSMFEIENLAPGMTVFGLSFMTLLRQRSSQRIAKARFCSGFIQHRSRLPTSFSAIPCRCCPLPSGRLPCAL